MCAYLAQAACTLLVTTVMSVGGKADFSTVVINIKSDTAGGEMLHYDDNKTSVFIIPQTGPPAKQLTRHMITTARLLAEGAVVLSANSTLEQSVGLVAYN